MTNDSCKATISALTGLVMVLVSRIDAQAPAAAAPVEVLPTLLAELPKQPIPIVAPGDRADAIKLADVDRDGDLDVVIGGFGLSQFPPRLLRNDGRGKFTDVTATQMPGFDAFTEDIAVGDLDGDGYVDIVLANQFIGVNPVGAKVLVNDGTGRFRDETTARLSTLAAGGSNVLLIDVDRDHDLDIVKDWGGGPLQLLLNDGRGFFSDATATNFPALKRTYTFGLAAGDLDGDGDADIAVGGNNGPRLLINDGAGHFTYESATRLPPLALSYAAPDFGDVEGDGDLDLLAKDTSGRLRLFLNDGSGYFTDGTAAHLPPTNRRAWRPYLRDLDGDGDLEIFVATTIIAGGIFNGAEQVLDNDGSGHFFDAAPRFITDLADGGSPMADFGDVDGDGDLDVVLADAGGGQYALGRERLYLNLTRQIHAYGNASLGQPYDLTIYGSPGQLAIPFAGVATQPSPIPPFGTFGLPLQAHLVLPPVTLTAIPGQPSMARGTCRIRIPQDPFLLSRTIYSQALLVAPSQPLASRLTNVMADVIQ